MNKIVLLLISLTCVFKANAQTFEEKDNSLVWKITNKDAKTSYIVLTTSGMCESNPALIAKVAKLADGIKIYYAETGIADPKNEKESQKYAFLNGSDESIKKILPENVYNQVKEQVSGLKLPDNIDKLSPIMINGIIIKTITPKCNVSNVTESLFRNYAGKYGVEVGQLLNLNDAFKVLSSYGNSYYAEQITYMLQNKDKVAADITKKAELYWNEDLKGIQELYAKSTFLNARYELKDLEKERTTLLVSKINEVANNGGALITIDLASVMNGQFSLFSELKNIGYDLQAVN